MEFFIISLTRIMVFPENIYDKSLMLQKSTIDLLGWIVEVFRSDSREPLHPPLVPVRQISADTNLSDLMCCPGPFQIVMHVHKAYTCS
jgi:hypothetical protein